MKLHHSGAKRLRRLSISTALTVGVVVAVLLINVLFSAFADRGLWFVDLTGYTRRSAYANTAEEYELYTVTPGATQLLGDTIADLNQARAEKGEDEVKIEIIFCDDPDNLMSNLYRRLVYMTAQCLQKQFPDAIEVRTVNIKRDPSQVQAYKTTSYTKFYPTSIIVASGTEYRHLTTQTFYMEDTTTNELWAYSGERKFLATIFEVTKAASPKAVLLTNHGESGYSDTFLSLLEDAGYEVIPDFDLENNELPEDCRLVVCVDPRTDFKGYNELIGTDKTSEIAKLEAFLDDENSMMVFFNADTPHLPNFEDYMEKWGISILRTEADAVGDRFNYVIKDTETSLSADGYSPVGTYATSGGGSSITSDMQAGGIPPKVVFKNSTAFKFSPRYRTVFVPADEEMGTEAYSYAGFYSSGIGRQAFDIFRAANSAVAVAGEEEFVRGEKDDPYLLMTIASETITTAGDRNGYTTVSHDSYVIACASSEFLSDEILTSGAYGNADLLASTLRTLGKDAMSALIEQYLKPFVDVAVQADLITDSQKTAYTVVLAALPALLLFGTGIVVVTKRKYS